MSENTEKKLTISDIVESVAQDFCDNYCKFPGEYGEEDDDYERLIDEKCSNFPLNRLS